MNVKRANHSSCAQGDMVYTFGGCGAASLTDYLDSIECINATKLVQRRGRLSTDVKWIILKLKSPS